MQQAYVSNLLLLTLGQSQKSLLQLADDETATDEVISYGSFLLNKLPIYTEWSRLLDMLPKWVHDKYLGQRKIKVSNWASR